VAGIQNRRSYGMKMRLNWILYNFNCYEFLRNDDNLSYRRGKCQEGEEIQLEDATDRKKCKFERR
jgi:hypothetical protein